MKHSWFLPVSPIFEIFVFIGGKVSLLFLNFLENLNHRNQTLILQSKDS